MPESHKGFLCPRCNESIHACRCVKEPPAKPVLPLANLEPVSGLLSKPPMPVEWLVDGIFPSGYVFMIYAPEGVGKSVLALNLALSVASNTPFLGRKTHSGRVIYLDEENPDSYVHDILTQMCRARKIAPESLADTFLMGRFALSGKKPDEWCGQLSRTVEMVRPELVVIDTFSALLPNVEGIENDAAVMRAYLRYIRIAKISCPQTSICVLHHPPRNADRPRGSGAIGQDVDAYYSLKRGRGRPGKSTVVHTTLYPGKARRLAGVPAYRITPKFGPESYDLTGEQIQTKPI